MRRFLPTVLLVVVAGCGGPVAKWSAQLKSGDASQRAEAARALSELGPKALPAVGALSEALGDESAEVQRLSAYALRQIGAEARASVPALEKTLSDSDADVRLAAAYAIQSIAPDNASPLSVLIAAAKKGDARAIVALGQMGAAAKDAIPALSEALSNRSTVVRVQVVQALARIDRNHKATQAALARAKNDPEQRVRQAAIDALK